MYRVELILFKASGKYYGTSFYTTKSDNMSAIQDEVVMLNSNKIIPGYSGSYPYICVRVDPACDFAYPVLVIDRN